MSNQPTRNAALGRKALGVAALGAVAAVLWLSWRGGQDTDPIRPGGPNPSTTVPGRPGTDPARFAKATTAREAFSRSRSIESGTPAEQVARRLGQFVDRRRAWVEEAARATGQPLPAAVTRFFELAARGTLGEIAAAYQELDKLRRSDEGGEVFQRIWPALNETFGVIEVTGQWPAQSLLDYGTTILDSLKPGTVYLGGTDPGRYIPTLLADGDPGRQVVVLTQNALSDHSYLDYARSLHGETLKMLSTQEATEAFQSYMNDAMERLRHDRAFPNEPPRLRPGETIDETDGRITVGGQVAVMAINELLTKRLMEKNPDRSFAMEESYPFVSMYAEALPTGPVLDLRPADGGGTVDAEKAAATASYWRDLAGHIQAEAEAADSSNVRNAWAKLAAAQSGLLQRHGFTAEAERTLQVAVELAPANPEVVFRYAEVLAAQGRASEAVGLARRAFEADPNQTGLRDLVRQLEAMNPPPAPKKP